MPGKKHPHKTYSFKGVAPYLSLLVIFFIPIIVYFTVKSQKIGENQSKAVTAENDVLLMSITNKVSRDYLTNGDFGQFKAGVPAGWSVYSPSNNSTPTLKPIKDKKYTYVNNSSILLDVKEENIGIIQNFPTGVTTPAFIQANILVVSGKFKLVVTGKNGVEAASESTVEDQILPADVSSVDDILPRWQRLAIGVTDPDTTIGSVKIVAAEPDSKAYVTNVVVHPYADYSDLFKEISAVQQNKIRLGECEEKENDEEYLACLRDKTGLPPEKWKDVGIPKLYWNGREIKSETLAPEALVKTNLKPLQSNGESQIVVREVPYIYFATDFVDKSHPANPTFFQNYVKSYIGSIGKTDGLRKQIGTDNTKIKSFDPTIASACSLRGYWSNVKIFMPDSYCTTYPVGSIENKLQYFFVRMGGWDGYYEGSKLFIDTNGKWDGMKHMIKHETFHFLGAPDSNFVEIRGNSLFRDGNSKKNTIWDDLMYIGKIGSDLKPSEYTVGIINSVEVFDWQNFWKFQPKTLVIKNAATDEIIRDGKYIIYLGYFTIYHIRGIIHPNTLVGFGELEDGNISLKKGQFLNYWNDTAGFIKIESGGKIYTGRFDLIDLSVAKFRGQDNLEVKVYPFAEGNVQIISPNDREDIYGLDNIIVNVHTPTGSKLREWILVASSDGEEKQLTAGENPIDGDRVYIPADKLSFLKDFEGEISLKLSAVYVYDTGELQLSDSKKYILHKPFIKKVEFMGPNKLIIEGKGFGNNEARVALRDKSNSKVTQISSSQRVFLLQDDYIQVEIGVPENPNTKYTPEEWRSKILDIVVIRRDGKATDEYNYAPAGNTSTAKVIVFAKPPQSFYYDPPYVSPETLTHHFEVKCQSKEDSMVYFGMETVNGLLDHKYVTAFSDCNDQGSIEQNFYLENTQAEKILEASQNGDYYWFACTPVGKENMSRFEKDDYEEDPKIIEFLGQYYDDSKTYDCKTGKITLNRRQYDSTPTPISIDEPVGEPDKDRCLDGSYKWDYTDGLCPENRKESYSTQYNTGSEDSPTEY